MDMNSASIEEFDLGREGDWAQRLEEHDAPVDGILCDRAIGKSDADEVAVVCTTALTETGSGRQGHHLRALTGQPRMPRHPRRARPLAQ